MFLSLRSKRYLWLFLAIAIVAAISSVQMPAQSMSQVVLSQSHLTTPLMDYLQYEQARLRLDNGVQIWLIHAPASDRAAVAICVGAGWGDDPKDHVGLAHFVEHTVFMGSEKFPKEDDFDLFVKGHGGEMNAYTAPDRTVYGVSCMAPAWPEAVERLGDMMKAAKLSQGSYERERKAIDEEMRKNLASDQFISYQNLFSQLDQNHPLNALMGGNEETLAQTGEEQLRSFMKKHYTGSNICVFAISSHPIKEMTQILEKEFGQLPAGLPKGSEQSWPSFAPEKSIGYQIWIPTPSDRELILTWSLPGFTSPNASVDFLSKALAHEQPGGLSDTLKSQGWILEMHSSCYQAHGQVLLQLIFSLSDTGLDHIDDIRSYVDDYMIFLKNASWPPIWLSERQNCKSIAWQLHVDEPTLENALFCASLMNEEPLEKLPEKSYWPTLESFQQAQNSLQCLSSNRYNIQILAPESLWPNRLRADDTHSLWQEDPWIHTPYLKERSEPIKPIHIDHWSLPGANPLLPLNLPEFFNLNEPEMKSHDVQASFGSLRVFPNNYQAGSRDSLTLAWQTQGASSLSKQEQIGSWMILNRLLQDHLQPVFEEASESGQTLRISPQVSGLEIRVDGYSGQSQNKLLEAVAKEIYNPHINQESFDQAINYLCQSLENTITDGPLDQFRSFLNSSLIEDNYPLSEQLDVLRSLDFSRFNTWLQEQSSCALRFDILAVSHRPQSQWLQFFEQLYQNKPRSSHSQILGVNNQSFSTVPFLKSWKNLTKDQWTTLHPRDGSMVIYLWPLESENFQELTSDYLATELLQANFSQQAFNQLRTQQQLGYVVASRLTFIGPKPTLMLLVLSSTYQVAEVEKAMDSFYRDFSTSLSQLSDEQFEQQSARMQFELAESSRSSYEALDKIRSWCWGLGLDPSLHEQWLPFAKKISKNRCIEQWQKILRSPPLRFTLIPGPNAGHSVNMQQPVDH